jgi:hypothetical protein
MQWTSIRHETHRPFTWLPFTCLSRVTPQSERTSVLYLQEPVGCLWCKPNSLDKEAIGLGGSHSLGFILHPTYSHIFTVPLPHSTSSPEAWPSHPFLSHCPKFAILHRYSQSHPAGCLVLCAWAFLVGFITCLPFQLLFWWFWCLNPEPHIC